MRYGLLHKLQMKTIFLLLLIPITIFYSACISAQNTATSFRFALITDTHLQQNNPQNEKNLRLTMQDINQQNDIDFVIVAGDIADKGNRSSFLKAKQILDSLRVPYHAVPGNHDTRYCKTTTSAFDSVFVMHHFAFAHKGYFFVGFNTGQGNGNNRGGVDPEELAWMQQELKKTGNTPVIAITHFPIVAFQVDDSAKIMASLLKYNLKAILGGHYHRNAVFDYAGIPGIISRTLQQNPAGKSGYSIFEISDHIQVLERDPATAASHAWLNIPLKQMENALYD